MNNKPDYSKWKPPFRYNGTFDCLEDSDGCELFSLAPTEALRRSIQDGNARIIEMDRMGFRIAALLNADAQEENK
jgi:hypothetical protein